MKTTYSQQFIDELYTEGFSHIDLSNGSVSSEVIEKVNTILERKETFGKELSIKALYDMAKIIDEDFEPLSKKSCTESLDFKNSLECLDVLGFLQRTMSNDLNASINSKLGDIYDKYVYDFSLAVY